jgi:putative transposase
MARPLRIEFFGVVYHITSRGSARQSIFLDSSDWDGFMDILSSVIARFDWVCHAYCLMENHYHLVIMVRTLCWHNREIGPYVL